MLPRQLAEIFIYLFIFWFILFQMLILVSVLVILNYNNPGNIVKYFYNLKWLFSI